MGGNLFKVGRIDKEQYIKIIDSLKPILHKNFGEFYKIPIPYHNKKDYGDVDIILDAGYVLNKPNWKLELINDLGVTQTQAVRNVFSMLYNNFQVDIFLVGTRRFESTYNFMCYNILGNLIGRIYHKFNLRYGEEGLFYVLRGFNNHISREVVVTRDMKKILTFIGLSYERWLEGFNDLNDIFEYVIDSKYFCSNSYNPAYFTVKKRAVERPDFVKFLEYVEKNYLHKNYLFDSNKEVYLGQIDEFFNTNLKKEYENHLIKQDRLEKISKKFNGRIIIELIGIEGKELGTFIGNYKNGFESETLFEDFILSATQKEIEQDILLHSTK